MDAIKTVPEIQLLNLSKSFSTAKGEIVALEDIGFSVKEGEFIVIVGA